MTNTRPRTTVAATTAPSSENSGLSPPGPNCGASPPARLPKSFMSVSMWRRRAGLTAQPQPAPAPQSGGSTPRNNKAVNKRTVRHRRKIATAGWQAAETGRSTRRPHSPFFRRGFPDRALASVGPWRQINDADIRSFASKIRAPSRRLSSFIGHNRPLPMRAAAAPEGCA